MDNNNINPNNEDNEELAFIYYVYNSMPPPSGIGVPPEDPNFNATDFLSHIISYTFFSTGVWKDFFFEKNKIGQMYRNYNVSNSEYIMRQPHYYQSLFDILN
jgi:hypothetical protein